MGEQVRMELYQSPQMEFNAQEYQPMIKVSNHFIAEDSREYQKAVQQLPGNTVTNRFRETSDNFINRNPMEKGPI